MRKINAFQILAFMTMLVLIFTLGISTTWLTLGQAPHWETFGVWY